MRMRVYTIDAIQDRLKQLPLDARVRRLILFGSHAKGTAQERSDIDFFLDSDGRITGFDFFALKATLEDAFQREIDLLPDVDVMPDSRVAAEIAREGVMVYARQ